MDTGDSVLRGVPKGWVLLGTDGGAPRKGGSGGGFRSPLSLLVVSGRGVGTGGGIFGGSIPSCVAAMRGGRRRGTGRAGGAETGGNALWPISVRAALVGG